MLSRIQDQKNGSHASHPRKHTFSTIISSPYILTQMWPFLVDCSTCSARTAHPVHGMSLSLEGLRTYLDLLEKENCRRWKHQQWQSIIVEGMVAARTVEQDQGDNHTGDLQKLAYVHQEAYVNANISEWKIRALWLTGTTKQCHCRKRKIWI